MPGGPMRAIVMRIAATHLLSVVVENATGTTNAAQIRSVILRALLVVQPRFMKEPASQPPAMLPTEATT